MNPTYTDQNGRKWEVTRTAVDGSGRPWDIPPADIPAVIEALKGWEEKEWPYQWTWAGGKCRANADGSRLEMWDYSAQRWADHSTSRTGLSFRKGLSTGKAQAKELAEAVLAIHPIWKSSGMRWSGWEPIVSLARSLTDKAGA